MLEGSVQHLALSFLLIPNSNVILEEITPRFLTSFSEATGMITMSYPVKFIFKI